MIGYVGYDRRLNTIIVGHQGTDKKKLYGHVNCLSLAVSQSPYGLLPALRIPLLTDANLIPVNLDSSLFPGIGWDVRVHAGFRVAHELCVLSSWDLEAPP